VVVSLNLAAFLRVQHGAYALIEAFVTLLELRKGGETGGVLGECPSRCIQRRARSGDAGLQFQLDSFDRLAAVAEVGAELGSRVAELVRLGLAKLRLFKGLLQSGLLLPQTFCSRLRIAESLNCGGEGASRAARSCKSLSARAGAPARAP